MLVDKSSSMNGVKNLTNQRRIARNQMALSNQETAHGKNQPFALVHGPHTRRWQGRRGIPHSGHVGSQLTVPEIARYLNVTKLLPLNLSNRYVNLAGV